MRGEGHVLRVSVCSVTHVNDSLKPAPKAIIMKRSRSTHTSRVKNLALAACAIMATAMLTAGDVAAQCRLGGGNSGYGYGTGNSGYGYNGANSSSGYSTANSGYGGRYTDGRDYNARNYTGRNVNSRLISGDRQGCGLSSYRGSSSQRPSLSFGLSLSGNRGSGFDSGYSTYGVGSYGVGNYNSSAYSNRSGSGGSYYSSNTRQPVSYRHGDRFDSEYGQSRSPLNRAGY